MKTITIALKDLLIITRDRSGFALMVIAPLALTLVVAFAFGGLGRQLRAVPAWPTFPSQWSIWTMDLSARSWWKFSLWRTCRIW
jgi:hypothetical protein